MIRLLLAVAAFSAAFSAVEDETPARDVSADTPENFEKQIKPLVAGIGKSPSVVIYEGLPHQRKEKELLARELKDKKTVKLHEFPFYAGGIQVRKEDAAKLSALCADLKTFDRYSGAKFCGGFHPDWCVEFKNGPEVYRVLICFGCREARLYGPMNDVYTDLTKESRDEFLNVLTPLWKNRAGKEPTAPKPLGGSSKPG